MKFNRMFLGFFLIVLTAACQSNKPDSELPVSGMPEKIHSVEDLVKAAQFNLKVSASTLIVTVIKDTSIPVKGSLIFKAGTVDLKGANPTAQVIVDMTSFDSGLPLRNDRVTEYFFRTQNSGMDTATFSLSSLPETFIATLREKKLVTDFPLTGELTFNGQTQSITGTFTASFDEQGTLALKSTKPITIGIAAWGLSENLKAINLICQHANLDDAVSVDVDLHFIPAQ